MKATAARPGPFVNMLLIFWYKYFRFDCYVYHCFRLTKKRHDPSKNIYDIYDDIHGRFLLVEGSLTSTKK